MRYPRFCGPSNVSQSPIADCERTVNWYIEPLGGSSRNESALYPVPGSGVFARAGGTDARPVIEIGMRGAITAAGRVFVVIGPTLYELDAAGGLTNRGTVGSDDRLVSMAYNGVAGGQLFIGSAGNGFLFTLATNALTEPLPGEATFVGMLSNRFLAFSPTTGKVRMSAQNDGATWDPTLYFQRGLAADPWQTMLVNPPNIWLLGTESGEVWYDSGAFPQPFAPVSGAFFRTGTAAPYSLGLVGDLVVWLGRSKDEGAKFVAARGYGPTPISNYAIDNILSAYTRAGHISSCELLTYGDQGHEFACWSSPESGSTWVFDAAVGVWHERGTWVAANNAFSAWTPRVHVAAFGRHLVGSRTSNAIGYLDPAVGTELDGSPIRRLRIPPPLVAPAGLARLVVDRLDVLLEPGLGAVQGQGDDPLLMLRTSLDAKRWGSERVASVGARGQYTTHVSFTRCGSSDTLWVPEISCSDPIPFRLLGAEVQGTGLSAQAEAAA